LIGGLAGMDAQYPQVLDPVAAAGQAVVEAGTSVHLGLTGAVVG
jgi:hypothetical protein